MGNYNLYYLEKDGTLNCYNKDALDYTTLLETHNVMYKDFPVHSITATVNGLGLLLYESENKGGHVMEKAELSSLYGEMKPNNAQKGGFTYIKEGLTTKQLKEMLKDVKPEIVPPREMKVEVLPDNINKPSHYTKGIETYAYISSWDMSFPQGNVVKYVSRYKYKNGLEDLKKARWYLNKLIEEYKE